MANIKERRILFITGTRAEFGLLLPLMQAVKSDVALKLQILATGMHLVPAFGLTYQAIEAAGFEIDAQVDMLLASNSPTAISKAMGLGLIGMTDAITRLAPDIIIILGDRFEALVAAQVALVHRIPVAHIHGGELTQGAIDDAMRHCITKLSALHFVAAPAYAARVRQLGEEPQHIKLVGTLGLERIQHLSLRDKSALAADYKIKFRDQTFLITLHPTTLANKSIAESCANLFKALDNFPDALLVFTKANADVGGQAINDAIEKYITQGRDAICIANLGDVDYFSFMQFATMMIGNSSSGLLEVPYFKKPTINIGERQACRLRASSVIDCADDDKAIIAAINLAMSPRFQLSLEQIDMPYLTGTPTQDIINTLKYVNLNNLQQKIFQDLPGALHYA